VPNITLSINKELKEKMDSFPEINWSEMTRKLISKEIESMNDLAEIKRIVSKSEFTEKDVDELAEKIKKKRHLELKKLGLI